MSFSISGTYDALVVPILLPASTVLSLLPPEIRSLEPSPLVAPSPAWLASVGLSEAEGSSSPAPKHPVWLQLGYQQRSGPGPSWALPLKQSFYEAKLEIPFVRHPALAGNAARREEMYTFKNIILFSSALLAAASNVTPGLRSKTATFQSDLGFDILPADTESIVYSAKDYVDVAAKRVDSAEVPKALEAEVKELMQGQWFGSKTGRGINKFTFDFAAAPVAPTPYRIKLQLNLDAFTYPAEGAQESSAVKRGSVDVDAWGIRSRARFHSKAWSL